MWQLPEGRAVARRGAGPRRGPDCWPARRPPAPPPSTPDGGRGGADADAPTPVMDCLRMPNRSPSATIAARRSQSSIKTNRSSLVEASLSTPSPLVSSCTSFYCSSSVTARQFRQADLGHHSNESNRSSLSTPLPFSFHYTSLIRYLVSLCTSFDCSPYAATQQFRYANLGHQSNEGLSIDTVTIGIH